MTEIKDTFWTGQEISNQLDGATHKSKLTLNIGYEVMTIHGSDAILAFARWARDNHGRLEDLAQEAHEWETGMMDPHRHRFPVPEDF